ncbi:MAG: PspA/IM30 family protein [Candidatus Riflebacteria bacterium]|nr:PspA/IM30 family protein [Candidatus Riflebacteria bacterium]
MLSIWAGIRGWLSGKQDDDDPSKVFQRAVDEFRERYRKTRDVVAAVIRERDAVRAEFDRKKAEVAKLHQQARAAVKAKDDATALVCLEREKAMERTLDDLEHQLGDLEQEASRARQALLKLDQEVERLERDRQRAANLDQRARAHSELRDLVRDIETGTESPELDRARSSLEHASLAQRIAHEMDTSDAGRPPRADPSVADRLKALKDETGS